MVTELHIGLQLVRVDIDATAALYRNADTRAGADECTCASCKNFAAQRAKAYPDSSVRWSSARVSPGLNSAAQRLTSVVGCRPVSSTLLRQVVVVARAGCWLGRRSWRGQIRNVFEIEELRHVGLCGVALRQGGQSETFLDKRQERGKVRNGVRNIVWLGKGRHDE